MAEHTRYAELSWSPADVQSLTENCDPDSGELLEPTMSLEDAEEWLARNSKFIQERLCEYGWTVIESMLAAGGVSLGDE